MVVVVFVINTGPSVRFKFVAQPVVKTLGFSLRSNSSKLCWLVDRNFLLASKLVLIYLRNDKTKTTLIWQVIILTTA